MNRKKSIQIVVSVLVLAVVSVVLIGISAAAAQEGRGQAAARPAPATRPAAGAPPSAPGDAAKGKAPFEENCAVCHGIDASGGDGPNLQQVSARLGGDAAVENIIRRGRPGTAMPSFNYLPPQDPANIVAYLHKLGEDTASEPVHGDSAKGKAIFASAGCIGCHMVHGEGGDVGPDLSHIGSMRGPTNLKARLDDPAANLPHEGNVGDRGKWTQYLMFRAVDKDGKVIEGMRFGEDSFTIVLKDPGGNFHSLSKPTLRSLEKEPNKSIMPSFKGVLTPAQVDDLVAYLMTLKD